MQHSRVGISGWQDAGSVVRLDAGDMAELAALEALCFSTPWTASQFQSAMETPYFIAYGLKNQGRLLAYITFDGMPDEKEILNLATRPGYRRLGLARRLLLTSLAELTAFAQKGGQKRVHVMLEVRENNTPAFKLYQAAGFYTIGRRKGYYRDTGEDALVMRWESAGGQT